MEKYKAHTDYTETEEDWLDLSLYLQDLEEENRMARLHRGAHVDVPRSTLEAAAYWGWL